MGHFELGRGGSERPDEVANYKENGHSIHSFYRTMAFAMFAGMGCVTSIYTAMNIAFFTLLNPDQMRTSDAVAMVGSILIF